MCIDWTKTGLCVPTHFHHFIRHFRCEEADLSGGCDAITMTQVVPNTRMNTDGEEGEPCSKAYLMDSVNRLGMKNTACAYYLPPLDGCRWELWLLKPQDPIVDVNKCQCDCEDNVNIKEAKSDFPNKMTYCEFGGFCKNPTGPHNVEETLPFFTGKSL